jgi:flagellar hook-basal body complex protein FliE
MTPIGAVNPLASSVLGRLDPAELTGVGGPNAAPLPPGGTAAVPTDSFSAMLDNLVGTVNAKEVAATQQTTSVLMGDSGALHQSMIAMQESGVAFSLMVQVRNKLVDSYQELMRMQV